jgi:hypothetical protein
MKRHGGRRAGAGRPRIDEESQSLSRCITMPPGDWEHVEAVGDGNASAGVRELVKRDRKRRNRTARCDFA